MHTLNQSFEKKDMLSDTYVTVTALWANSADDKMIHFLVSSHRIGLDISCKLSPQETICGDNLHEISKPGFWER